MLEYKEKVETILSRESHYSDYHRRDILADTYSWAIPNEKAIEVLVERSPVIEIGAGNGYWASLIKEHGGQITAYDREPPEKMYTNVYEESHTILDTLDSDWETLFLCWPPLGNRMAEECLDMFSGETIIYIGEWRGKTATDNFHTKLRKEYSYETTVSIPQWENVNDKLFVFSK